MIDGMRNSGKIQEPSKDANGLPPTHPDACLRAGPTPMPAQSSTQVATDADVPEVAIAIMGATGSGKSTFINLISGADLGVSNGLRSCTSTVQLARSFDLGGRHVVLIDTPGFDDTTRSDTDVLNTIASFLATVYERGGALAGVLYFHRISDFRMGGVSTRNFKMFQKLCGESAFQNVVIVTNMWGEVDPRIGEAREAELMTDDMFFKPVLDKGAQTARHENTLTSAQNIIRRFLDNHPIPLRIQVELIDEHKDISETGAGEELGREINAQIVKHQEEMRVLMEEMEQAMRDKDEETRRELEIEAQKMQREIERFENDAKRFGSDYRKEKDRLATRPTRTETEAKQEIGRITAQYQQKIDKLEDHLRASNATSNLEKAEMRRQLNELQARARASIPVPTSGIPPVPTNGIPPGQSPQIFAWLEAFLNKWLPAN